MTVRRSFTPELLALFQTIEDCFQVFDEGDMVWVVSYTQLVVESEKPKQRPKLVSYCLDDFAETDSKIIGSISDYEPLWERASSDVSRQVPVRPHTQVRE